MDEGKFYFILAMIAAATVVIFIEWLYRKFNPTPDETEKENHRRLMEEIRRHKDD